MKKSDKEIKQLQDNQDRLLTHVIIGYIVDLLLIAFLILKG